MKKIETLTYTNTLGESVVFAHGSLYSPQSVEGLTNVRNTLYTINSMGQDGDTFVANRIESRDIDISGAIRERDPDKMRDARRNLARVLNPQMAATLTYQYGDFIRMIACRSINAPTISKSPQSPYTLFTVQLSCLNPFWRERNESRDDIAAWVGGLEFPLEIPSPPDGLIMGYRQPSLIVNVYNAGDVDTGIRVEFRALGEVTNPIITNVDTREALKLNLHMEDGDVLTVSTGYGEKWAQLNRGGLITDALRYVDVDSIFLQLAPGDNLMRYNTDDGLNNLEVSIFHSNLYLGV